jgi:ketosteroid isomerase-like protein
MNDVARAGLAMTAAVIVVLTGTGAPLNAQRAADGNATVRAAIEAGNKKFADGAAKHDAALIAKAYTEDAEAFPPNSEVVKGRPALQKLWQSVLDSGIAAIELKTTEVEAESNLAYEVGTYAMKTKEGNVADRGKYCVVWKRVNGQWLLHRDIWTTSLPEAKK